MKTTLDIIGLASVALTIGSMIYQDASSTILFAAWVIAASLAAYYRYKIARRESRRFNLEDVPRSALELLKNVDEKKAEFTASRDRDALVGFGLVKSIRLWPSGVYFSITPEGYRALRELRKKPRLLREKKS